MAKSKNPRKTPSKTPSKRPVLMSPPSGGVTSGGKVAVARSLAKSLITAEKEVLKSGGPGAALNYKKLEPLVQAIAKEAARSGQSLDSQAVLNQALRTLADQLDSQGAPEKLLYRYDVTAEELFQGKHKIFQSQDQMERMVRRTTGSIAGTRPVAAPVPETKQVVAAATPATATTSVPPVKKATVAAPRRKAGRAAPPPVVQAAENSVVTPTPKATPKAAPRRPTTGMFQPRGPRGQFASKPPARPLRTAREVVGARLGLGAPPKTPPRLAPRLFGAAVSPEHARNVAPTAQRLLERSGPATTMKLDPRIFPPRIEALEERIRMLPPPPGTTPPGTTSPAPRSRWGTIGKAAGGALTAWMLASTAGAVGDIVHGRSRKQHEKQLERAKEAYESDWQHELKMKRLELELQRTAEERASILAGNDPKTAALIMGLPETTDQEVVIGGRPRPERLVELMKLDAIRSGEASRRLANDSYQFLTGVGSEAPSGSGSLGDLMGPTPEVGMGQGMGQGMGLGGPPGGLGG